MKSFRHDKLQCNVMCMIVSVWAWEGRRMGGRWWCDVNASEKASIYIWINHAILCLVHFLRINYGGMDLLIRMAPCNLAFVQHTLFNTLNQKAICSHRKSFENRNKHSKLSIQSSHHRFAGRHTNPFSPNWFRKTYVFARPGKHDVPFLSTLQPVFFFFFCFCFLHRCLHWHTIT